MKTAYALILACLPLVACAGADSAEDGQGEDDVTGTVSAKLVPQTFKRTIPGNAGSSCTYDVSYLSVQVPNTDASSPAVIKAKSLNTALYYGEQHADNKCTEPGGLQLKGGYTRVAVNANNVLSVAYSFTTESGTGVALQKGVRVRTVNWNLATGAPIALGELLTIEGKSRLIAGCEDGLTKVMTELETPATFEFVKACERAITVRGAHTTEDFTIEKAGLRVHIHNVLSNENSAHARSGFLVKWAQLGTELKQGSPVESLRVR